MRCLLSCSALVILVQSRRVEHGIVITGNKLMRQMRGIVKRQLAPSISRIVRIERESAKLLSGALQRVQSIIMTSCAIGNVPR